jgi:hypothetical protein
LLPLARLCLLGGLARDSTDDSCAQGRVDRAATDEAQARHAAETAAIGLLHGRDETRNCQNPTEHDDWHVADLALCHYAEKWKAAKEHASILHASYSQKWWMSARQYYLELGGLYREQMGGCDT